MVPLEKIAMVMVIVNICGCNSSSPGKSANGPVLSAPGSSINVIWPHAQGVPASVDALQGCMVSSQMPVVFGYWAETPGEYEARIQQGDAWEPFGTNMGAFLKEHLGVRGDFRARPYDCISLRNGSVLLLVGSEGLLELHECHGGKWVVRYSAGRGIHSPLLGPTLILDEADRAYAAYVDVGGNVRIRPLGMGEPVETIVALPWDGTRRGAWFLQWCQDPNRLFVGFVPAQGGQETVHYAFYGGPGWRTPVCAGKVDLPSRVQFLSGSPTTLDVTCATRTPRLMSTDIWQFWSVTCGQEHPPKVSSPLATLAAQKVLALAHARDGTLFCTWESSGPKRRMVVVSALVSRQFVNVGTAEVRSPVTIRLVFGDPNKLIVLVRRVMVM